LIEITRAFARAFRAVLKKIANARGQRDQPSTIVLQTDRYGLHVRARNASIAVEFSRPGSFAANEIAIPSEAFADFEGRKDDTVQLERSARGVTASWQDGVVPKTRSYAVVQAKQLPVMPAMPTRMEQQAEELLRALRDASATAANDAVRYAVNNIQLRGKQGKIIGTDGKQLLVQQGYAFPWDDDVLVPASSVFGCKELANYGPVSIGRSEQFVSVTVGPWALHLAIDKDGRFPNVDTILDANKGNGTVLELDPGDAQFLLVNLDSLPGATNNQSPVTVDANGQVSIRAKGEDQPTPTEVLLARSQVQGRKAMVATDRSYLVRALQLGFNRISVYGAEKPVICRDEKRQYVWQPLEQKATVSASKDVIRLSSADSAPIDMPGTKEAEAVAMSNTTADQQSTSEEPSTTELPAPQTSERSGIAAVLAEAEAIKELLRQAYTRTHQLITDVKRYRKQAQAVKTALGSLRQLQEVAG
jgi:hypothetical protein